MGNTIDRQPQNGGNGCGYQTDIAYTLTSCDRHAVFSRQRVDVFQENDVASTESARQHKDATDLVLQTYQQTVGTIGYTDHKGINNQYVGEDKCIVEGLNLIRRLTPLECERLQGFPDGWTNIPSASDSARYKALGNSVAIPCVEYVMQGIALVLKDERRRRGSVVDLINEKNKTCYNVALSVSKPMKSITVMNFACFYTLWGRFVIVDVKSIY